MLWLNKRKNNRWLLLERMKSGKSVNLSCRQMKTPKLKAELAPIKSVGMSRWIRVRHIVRNAAQTSLKYLQIRWLKVLPNKPRRTKWSKMLPPKQPRKPQRRNWRRRSNVPSSRQQLKTPMLKAEPAFRFCASISRWTRVKIIVRNATQISLKYLKIR